MKPSTIRRYWHWIRYPITFLYILTTKWCHGVEVDLVSTTGLSGFNLSLQLGVASHYIFPDWLTYTLWTTPIALLTLILLVCTTNPVGSCVQPNKLTLNMSL